MGELKMELQDVATYLQHKLDAPDLRVTDLTRFPRGVSRETWFVDTEVSKGGKSQQKGFVIRRDLPGRSICTASRWSRLMVPRGRSRSRAVSS